MGHKVFCLGLGEIGGAIQKIEEHAGNKVQRATKTNQMFKAGEFKVMHVALPYVGDGAEFFEAVAHRHKKVKPEMVINHSTTPIGANAKLAELIGDVVHHSPVRGMHPDLYQSIKYVFVKYTSSIQSAVYLRGIGIEKVEPLGTTAATEAIKLLDTTYYGWNILFAELAREICEQYGLDYGIVYEDANHTYNDGYRKLDKYNVVRPVLTPPEGGIGGHCISQNFKLLPEGKLKEICEELNQRNINTFIERQKNQDALQDSNNEDKVGEGIGQED